MKQLSRLVRRVFSEPKLFWPVVAITFFVSRLGTWLYPFDSDHWIFFYVGKNWFHGGSLYLTAWDHKPPIIFFINGLMSLVTDNIVIHRIFFTLVAILGCYLFYRLLKKILPKLQIKQVDLAVKVGLLTYVFWVNLSQFTSSANNTENFGVIFLLAMLLSYLSYREKGNLWWLFATGIFMSILFFLKGNFILLALPIGLYIIIENRKDFWKIIRDGIVFVTPLIIHAGLWIWYFGSPSRINDFVIATLQFSAKYSSSAWVGQLSGLAKFYTLVAIASPLLIVVPIWYLAIYKRNFKKFEYGFIAMILTLGTVAFFAVGVPYLYYFLVMFPIYMIAVVYLLFSKNGIKGKSKKIFIFIFFAGSLLNLGYCGYQLYQNNRGATRSEAVEYQQIADYVDQHTVTSDKVFDYDYGATFYELAHRDSGSRYISASILLLDYHGRYGFDLDKIFISDMEKSRTKYVVMTKKENNIYEDNKPIVNYFNLHYKLEKVFNTFVLLRRID